MSLKLFEVTYESFKLATPIRKEIGYVAAQTLAEAREEAAIDEKKKDLALKQEFPNLSATYVRATKFREVSVTGYKIKLELDDIVALEERYSATVGRK